MYASFRIFAMISMKKFTVVSLLLALTLVILPEYVHNARIRGRGEGGHMHHDGSGAIPRAHDSTNTLSHRRQELVEKQMRIDEEIKKHQEADQHANTIDEQHEEIVPNKLTKSTRRPLKKVTKEQEEPATRPVHSDVEREMCRRPNVMPYCVALNSTEMTRQQSTNQFTCEACYNERNSTYKCGVHSADQAIEAKIVDHEICMHPQMMPMLIDLPRCVAVVKTKFHSLAELVAGCQHSTECQYILIEPYRVHFCPSTLNSTSFIFNECSLIFDTKTKC